MLAELMRLRYGIAIAGAHGKTTTTSMVALVLERAGLDPTAVIGGRLSAFGSNARLGRGDSIVVEADESDRSFLKLSPALALVTNLDREHMEAYGSWEALKDAFLEFINKVPFYGAAVLCTDDEAVRALVPRAIRRVITYGLPATRGRRCRRTDMQLEPFGVTLHVTQKSTDATSSSGRSAAGTRPAQPAQRAGRRRDRARAPGPVPPHRRRRSLSSAVPNGASRCAASAAA